MLLMVVLRPNKLGNLRSLSIISKTLATRKAELEELISALAASYQQKIDIILTAPGIKNPFTAIGIISEIGVNMEAFLSAKHLCSWAGLTPTNNESAGEKNLSGFPRPDAISSQLHLSLNICLHIQFLSDHHRIVLLSCDSGNDFPLLLFFNLIPPRLRQLKPPPFCSRQS